MQFGFSANAFREHTAEETVEAVAAAGYDGVELLFDAPHLYPGTADAGAEQVAPADAEGPPPPAVDEADVARVKDALDDHDLAVSNCNAFMLTAIEGFHHPSFVEPDADYRQERIDYTRAAVELATEFEGQFASGVDRPHVSIEPGGPVPAEFSRDQALELFTQSLGQVVPVAEDAGVDVLVEPEPDLLVETTDQFLELMDVFAADTDALGCNFDAGHLFCVGEEPASQVKTLAEYTRHYHLEDIPADRSHEHTRLGDGAMDLDGFLQAVDDSGYDGFVTVELYPYQESPAETARAAMDWLEEHGWA